MKGEHFPSLGRTILLDEFSLGVSAKLTQNKAKLNATLQNLHKRRIVNNHVSRCLVSKVYATSQLSYLYPNSSLNKKHLKDVQKSVDIFTNKKTIMSGQYKYLSFSNGDFSQSFYAHSPMGQTYS